MTAKEIQKLDYQREGIRYTIHVEAAQDDLMWGTWNCHDCGVGGRALKNLPPSTKVLMRREATWNGTTLLIIGCEGALFSLAPRIGKETDLTRLFELLMPMVGEALVRVCATSLNPVD